MEQKTEPPEITDVQTGYFKLTKQRFIYVYIFLIVVFAGISIYLGYQNLQLHKRLTADISGSKSQSASESPTIDTTEEWTIPEATAQEIEDIFTKVHANSLEFTNKFDNVQYYSKDFDLSQHGQSAGFGVTVYKYYPGAKLEEGYEGMKWTRNLDIEVQFLKKISSLARKTFIYPDIPVGQELTVNDNLTIRQIGDLKYAVTDSFFQPSRGNERRYRAFDSESNQLINVTMGIGSGRQRIQSQEVCFEDKCATIYAYPEDVRIFFLNLETLMAGQ